MPDRAWDVRIRGLGRSAAVLAVTVSMGVAAAPAAQGAPGPAGAKAQPRIRAAAAPKGRLPRAAATPNGLGVTLRWTRPRGTRSTTIESRDLTFRQKRWHRVPGAVRGTRRTVTGLRAGHAYRFRLRYRTVARKGRPSRLGRPGRSILVRLVNPPTRPVPMPGPATPGPVADLRIATSGTDGVALSWSAAPNATTYRVERIDAATGAVDRLPDVTTTSHTDVPPATLAGRWLTYRVVARNATIDAAPSPTVEARAAGLPTYSRFYALGDSYAAGTGLGQPYDDQECSRSNQMWAALISRSIVPEPQRIACSGAETVDVRLSGEGGVPQYPDLGGTQLDLVQRDLPAHPGPTLVTFSIGGNDAQFIPEFTRCVTGDCTGDAATETALIRGPVRQQLDATFDQVRRVAPHSDVLAVGYPHLFTEDAVPLDPIFALSLTTAERKLANVWAQQVDDEIAASARAHGLHPVTDEVVAAFAGHGAGGAAPWINAIEFLDPQTPIGTTPPLLATKSVHPNAQGNAAYAVAVEQALRSYASRVRLR